MRYLIACFFPPLAVYFSGGGLASIALNILLTTAGFVPGVLHAAWKVSQFHQGEKEVWLSRRLHGVNEPTPGRWPFVIAFPLAVCIALPVWLTISHFLPRKNDPNHAETPLIIAPPEIANQ